MNAVTKANMILEVARDGLHGFNVDIMFMAIEWTKVWGLWEDTVVCSKKHHLGSKMCELHWLAVQNKESPNTLQRQDYKNLNTKLN